MYFGVRQVYHAFPMPASACGSQHNVNLGVVWVLHPGDLSRGRAIPAFVVRGGPLTRAGTIVDECSDDECAPVHLASRICAQWPGCDL